MWARLFLVILTYLQTSLGHYSASVLMLYEEPHTEREYKHSIKCLNYVILCVCFVFPYGTNFPYNQDKKGMWLKHTVIHCEKDLTLHYATLMAIFGKIEHC